MRLALARVAMVLAVILSLPALALGLTAALVAVLPLLALGAVVLLSPRRAEGPASVPI